VSFAGVSVKALREWWGARWGELKHTRATAVANDRDRRKLVHLGTARGALAAKDRNIFFAAVALGALVSLGQAVDLCDGSSRYLDDLDFRAKICPVRSRRAAPSGSPRA
jgi:hypothetical protein